VLQKFARAKFVIINLIIEKFVNMKFVITQLQDSDPDSNFVIAKFCFHEVCNYKVHICELHTDELCFCRSL